MRTYEIEDMMKVKEDALG